MNKYTVKLYESRHGFPRPAEINADGGQCLVITGGDTSKVSLLDSAGAAATNPVVGVRGEFTFYVANATTTVDIYLMAPWGQFVVLEDIVPGTTDLMVDTGNQNQTYIIPFASEDYTDATEFDTGMEILEHAVIKHDGMGVYVNDVGAADEMDVGLLSTESGGDADGFMDAILMTTAGYIAAEVGFTVGASASYVDLTGGDVEFTYGILMAGAGTKAAVSEGSNANTDEGFYLLKNHIGDGTAKTICYTLTAGSKAAEVSGLIILPAFLPVPHKRTLAV
jgi:hypothetical protein